MADKSKYPKEELLHEAKERFKLSSEAFDEIRRAALEDLEFRAGDHWPDDVRRERELDGRPCLTINRIPQFIRQITNDQRQNRPSIKVHPVDDNGDPETAKILQGLIRHIEYNSNADAAYDTAFDGAVTGGFGYFRIVTDYVDPTSFEQEILIKRVRNPFSVYPDPASQEPDGSDMKYCFIVEDLTREEFERQYPKAEKKSAEEFQSIGDKSPEWYPGDKVRLAEYFYLDHKEMELVMLADGTIVDGATLGEDVPEEAILKKRTAHVPIVKWCVLNRCEILDEKEWVGRWIPVIPVYGEELDINGKRCLEGVVRHAKDSQRMYDYWASSETETIALAPRAPYVGAEGQFEGHEAMWQQANRKNLPFLQYNPKSVDGTLLPAPQRQVYEAPVQAITQARMQASEDLKATTGIYDAALGARSNETSGIAIQRRNIQAQTSNFHFVDNLTRALRHAGRILVDLIPKIYDTPRAARIVGEDGEQEIVRINELFVEHGQQKGFMLGAGKYDVTIETGPSYATKRQEAVASMLELTKAYPQAAQVAGDLMVKNMDWPGAQEIAERIKKTLPPGIAEDRNKAPIPPEVQAQMAQMSQMLEQLTKELEHRTKQIESKTIELESKERIEMAKIQADIEIEMAKLGSVEALALLKTEVAEIQGRLSQLNYYQPFEHDLGATQEEMPPEQMPTGGPAPGNPMGEMP